MNAKELELKSLKGHFKITQRHHGCANIKITNMKTNTITLEANVGFTEAVNFVLEELRLKAA